MSDQPVLFPTTSWHHDLACERGRTATANTCLCWLRYAAAFGIKIQGVNT